MTEKIFCEKCGAEMNSYQKEGSCGMLCPSCGWGWATSYTNPIDEDETEYVLTVSPIQDPSLDAVKCIAQIMDCNFINAKSTLKHTYFSKTEKASEIKNIAKALLKAGIKFTISPEFPYDIKT